ncbi:MAG: LysR family transcriptional regulator [Paracoccaceae bacterium]|nr:LysR family transcriptional regulator [Paracoccaceae bacterium]
MLLVFLGLIRTRKAADVASELGLTNSSISHAIRRLRDVFQDDLFIRKPHGLDPTAFALQIEPDVRRAIDAVQSALAGPSGFAPATATGLIRLAAREHETATLFPRVLSKATAEAPGIRFSVQSLRNADAIRGLVEGTTDFAIGFHNDPGENFERIKLRTESYVVVAHRDHQVFQRPLTLEAYLQQRHALVSRDGDMSGIVDKTLAKTNHERTVALAIPSFFSAFSILSESELIATVPESIAHKFGKRFGLCWVAPPLGIRSFDISILRHRRNVRDPMLSWCLSLFLDGIDAG